MELYHLKTFVTVAEEGHLTRAAERLFTSQPAISAHIKALEEELGVTLFERTPKGMQLSPAGAQLLAQAQRTLAAAGDFKLAARAMQDELMGSVRIGLNTDARFLRLVELQALLGARYPRLEVAFLGGSTGVNVPNLRVGKLDASFISGEGDDPLLSSQVLCEEELVIAAPTHLRDQLAACDVPALAALPWVYTSPDCAHYRVMRTLFEAHCCAPEKVVLANQEDALRGMVEAGVGLGIVRRDDMREAVAAGRVFIVPRELSTVSLRFAWLGKRANDPVLRAVVEAVLEVWQVAPAEARAAG